MKNRIAITMLCGIIAILCAGPVFGATTVITHDYGREGYVPQPGAFSEIYDTYGVISDTRAFSDNFELTTPDVDITGAVLELRFSGTQTENWWTIGTNPDIDIFKLRSTPDNTFISQIFTFTVDDLKDFYAGFDDHGIFTLTFSEKIKNSNHEFNLDWSQVTFHHQPSAIPIPGAALLLGSGLLGLVCLRRRTIL